MCAAAQVLFMAERQIATPTTRSSKWTESLRHADLHFIPAECVRPAKPDRASPEDIDLPESMGTDRPRVSVIIPLFRDAEYLPDALESVADQTMSDLEVILVDSSGTDWVKALTSDRRWIRHVPIDPCGVSAARNEGVAHARGDYIALLDVDDYWHPEKLSRQLQVITPETPISFTGYYLVNYWRSRTPSIGTKDITAGFDDSPAIDMMYRRIDAHISTIVCTAEILPDRPFDEHRSHFEDVQFTIERFVDHTPAHVPAPLAIRRLRPGSLAERTSEIRKCEERVSVYEYLKDNHPQLHKPAERMIAQETYRMGLVHLRRGERQVARALISESLGSHPEPIRGLGAYLLTFVPLNPETMIEVAAKANPSRGTSSVSIQPAE